MFQRLLLTTAENSERSDALCVLKKTHRKAVGAAILCVLKLRYVETHLSLDHLDFSISESFRQ